MKIRVKLGIASTLGLLIAAGFGLQARAQVGLMGSPLPNGADGVFNTFNPTGMQQAQLPRVGSWAEIITVTPKWMVVQNEFGQQFPIAAERVRQFLVRWPYSTDQLSPQSMIEVLGPNGAGTHTVIADHIDVYEGSAQSLVSPTMSNLVGNNRSLNFIDIDQQNTYGIVYYMSPEEYAIPNRLHVVGNFLGAGDGQLRIEGPGLNWFTVQPSGNGMSVSQVTLGSNAYARRGDLVYLLPEIVRPRGIDVTQLVLYKKIPLRAFQR
jgi:hypothetical protein